MKCASRRVILYLIALATSAVAAAAQASPIQFQANTNKCIDVQAASTANGTPVQLYDCNGTDAQNWTYTNGTLQVLGGKCLDVTGGVNQNGTLLQIWDCTANDVYQQWTLSGNTLVWAGQNKCIDLPSGNQTNGAHLQVWDCGGNNANQRWNTSFGSTTTPVTSDLFGPNVLIFDPSMSASAIQKKISAVFDAQQSNQFGNGRYTYLFKPGSYNLDVQVGFYMTVLGLGASPDDVVITGAVRSKADWDGGNATQNFWRGTENLAIVPTLDSGAEVWAVSQATTMRRVHIKGSINLSDNGWSSGGFIADSQIDTQINSGTQQQFLTRNTGLTNWQGGSWNMVFVGDQQAPSGTWSNSPYTVVTKTPVIREKPFLSVDSSGNYQVMVPALKHNSVGKSWGATSAAVAALPISTFYIAQSAKDTADTLNAALQSGKNLLLTPGVYALTSALVVNNPNTIVLGLGLATLRPTRGTPAMTVADVDGVSIGGVLFDAGSQQSPTLLRLGEQKTSVSHASNPTALYDISCRVGGAAAGSTQSCVTINTNNALIDNAWLWRADHGNGVGWTVNPAANGIIVNGDNVTAYGLFVEHFEAYQTVWNGNGGQVYFYQSEIPYDVPNQASWTHGGVKGYASYKVADAVTSHAAYGLGVYCVFNNPVVLENAIETPTNSGVKFAHMITEWLGVASGSAINHIINGTGGAVSNQNMQAKSAN